jgi:outer membrane protein assembly factor BamB
VEAFMGAGGYTAVGEGGWKDLRCMAEAGGRLFMISSGTLYSVNPKDGTYEEIGGGGWDARAMVNLQGKLYVFSGDGALYKVDPASGEYETLGEGGWANTTGAAVVGGKLFAVCDDTLYAVEI